MEILTLIAIFLGPISAVLITRIIDKKRNAHQQQLTIFRILMQNRRQPLSPAFVGALNLIEIEFNGNSSVVNAWKDLQNQLNTPQTEDHHQSWLEQVDKKQALLLDQMAKSLGFQIQQLDIYRGGYGPQAWLDNQIRQKTIQDLLASILEGKRGFPIELYKNEDNSNL